MTGPTTDPRTWTGAPVTGAAGEPLGRVAAIYHDDASGRAAWAAVAGADGHTALVPLDGARPDGGAVRVPFAAAQLQTAPHHDPGGRFSYDDGAQLYRHYGLAPAAPAGPPEPADPAVPPAVAVPAASGEPSTSGAGGDRAGGAMTRWEEQLRVGAATVATGRVRLRKYAVTEEQTFTVPVTREEVRIDYEDLPDTGSGAPGELGAGLSEETVEVIRYEERVVITKELVPVERVRLVKRVVTGERTVSGEVRKEVVDADVRPVDGGGRR